MGGPARHLTLLAFAAAAQLAAAATDRFVPADPGFVVENLGRAPDPGLHALVVAWRAEPAGDAATTLATALLERARTSREPNYVGRAESVLAPLMEHGTAAQRRLYAETLQFRHDFTRAESLLDAVLSEDPRDSAARTQRASIRLVRGDFAGARADCARLVAAADSSAAIGVACLAEALAGTGELARGRDLLATFPVEGADARARAYLLTVRAELAERAADSAAALADYRAALALDPQSDPIRAALADALLASGQREAARRVLDIERPGLALLLRQALAANGSERARLDARVRDWLGLERTRGDATHHREAALLALAAGRNAEALAAARANFEVQRELPDVRVLAGAAIAARDADAQRALRAWLDSTGFEDAVSERILAGSAGG
jgi:thioredoxin-like negative regulator of GroEL